MEHQLLLTADGSYTLRSPLFEENYHSKYGAIQESLTVFIQAGFELLHDQGARHLSILEVGFGTGLNAFLTYLEACRFGMSIDYLALEPKPIGPELAQALNYAQALGLPHQQKRFEQMHSQTNEWLNLSKSFQLAVVEQTLEDWQAPQAAFDLIYYDAFAPSAQPHLWEAEAMEKMYQALRPQGVLVTYCAKGNFKRLLKSLGFSIEALPGPIGKREMTRATKI